MLDDMGFHVLATARSEDATPGGPGWCSLPVPPMGEEQSLLVLEKCSGAVEGLPREWALLVRTCDLSSLLSRHVLSGTL